MSGRLVRIAIALVGVLAGAALTDADAAVQRTFVAAAGNDANPCSLVLPCRSFNAAMARTLADGEVIAVDSAGYGTVTITQPVSIIAPAGVYAGVTVIGGTGIVVDPGAGKVTLRGLTISGLGGSTGVEYRSGDALYIDGVTIADFPVAGLSADVAAGGSLHVANSTFRNNGTGATLIATGGTLTVAIDGATFERNATGVVFGDDVAGTLHGTLVTGGTDGVATLPTKSGTTAIAELRDCTISANSGVGARSEASATATSALTVVSTLVSGNGTGIAAQASGSTAFVSDSVIAENATGVASAGGGTLVSGGDNRLSGNTTDGAFTSVVSKL